MDKSDAIRRSDLRHTRRESFDGFDRKRLRGTLTAKLGIVTNADVFASKGNSWTLTQGEERRAAQERALLEHHLRQADTRTEQRFIQHLRERLADAGPPEPVRYDKQALASQKKQAKPARRAGAGKFAALALRVNRLAQLHKELTSGERVAAVTTDKRKEFGHFVLEKD